MPSRAYEAKARRPTLAGFLDDVALGGRESDDEKEKQLQRNAIVLMTLHSAKGLEFPHVYLVGTGGRHPAAPSQLWPRTARRSTRNAGCATWA